MPAFLPGRSQANFIFFAIVSGGIYFREFNVFTPGMWAGFILGVCIIFYGLFLLRPEEVIAPMESEGRQEVLPDCGKALPQADTAVPPEAMEAGLAAPPSATAHEGLADGQARRVQPTDSSRSTAGGATAESAAQSAGAASTGEATSCEGLRTPRDGQHAAPPPLAHLRRAAGGSFLVQVASVAQQSLPTSYNTPYRHRLSDPHATPRRSPSPGMSPPLTAPSCATVDSSTENAHP